MLQKLKIDSIELLKTLISIPSFSKEENNTADCLLDFFQKKSIPIFRKGNNVWVKNKFWKDGQPSILLNSHHDTVRPAKAWTKNPHQPLLENGKLFGLGSNDAGGCLVSLIATFLFFYQKENLNYNIILAATAEEEISGKNGIASVVDDFGKIDFGIIGEPTKMQMAIAEKGLMVVDGIAKGKAGHAAREEGVNAIYEVLEDLEWIRNYEFEEVSDLLGKTKITVTQINSGTQHNVVPDVCSFVIDVRTNEKYSNQAVFDILQKHLKSAVKARSFRLNSSEIPLTHPLVKSGLDMNLNYFGSPTLSDQALLSFPTLKIGCGDSARSHTADEFIFLKEIEEGIDIYIELLEKYFEAPASNHNKLSKQELKYIKNL